MAMIHVLDWCLGAQVSSLWMNPEGYLCWSAFPGQEPDEDSFLRKITAKKVIEVNHKTDQMTIVWYV